MRSDHKRKKGKFFPKIAISKRIIEKNDKKIMKFQRALSQSFFFKYPTYCNTKITVIAMPAQVVITAHLRHT